METRYFNDIFFKNNLFKSKDLTCKEKDYFIISDFLIYNHFHRSTFYTKDKQLKSQPPNFVLSFIMLLDQILLLAELFKYQYKYRMDFVHL